MTPEKLKEILTAHAAWLRGEAGGSRADLSGADLSGADLRDADLRGADLSDADLSGAVLIRAVLSGAVLSDADLSGAVLIRAVLSGAVLSRAVLSDAVLSDAVLSDAVLSDAVLSDAVLSEGIEQFAVPGLHRKMLAAIEAQPASFDMQMWHGSAAACGTTHCRAGWAVTLAGPAGKALEWAVGTSTAGALIHHASCPWLERVPDFYADNETALDDIRACAARETEIEIAEGEGKLP